MEGKDCTSIRFPIGGRSHGVGTQTQFSVRIALCLNCAVESQGRDRHPLPLNTTLFGPSIQRRADGFATELGPELGPILSDCS